MRFVSRSTIIRFIFLSLALSVLQIAQASTPSTGSLTPTSGAQTYTAGPYYVANATPLPMVDTGPRCNGSTFMCDYYTLTVTLPTGYAAAHPNDSIKVSVGWTDLAAGADYDLYVFKGKTTTQDGTESPDYSSATSSDPEVAYLPLTDGTTVYTVTIVPYTPTGETLMGRAELMTGAAVVTPPASGSTGPVVGTPRYQAYNPPPGAGNDTQGEFSIGWNSKTGAIMTLADLTTYKLTPPERVADPVTPSVMLPESCDATWTDVSPTTESIETLDPILWTDSASGRTFESQQTTGAQALFAYTDNDGGTWIPISAAPPNGGVDHETVGTGPYPAGSAFSAVASAAGFDYATYYCSQADFPAFCQRSDSGGTEFGPGVPIYNGVTTQCGGIHGHVRVAPNGAVYVPNKGCGTTQGGAVSMDAGVTWSEFLPPASTPGKWDPSVGLDADSTAYFCYDGADGHAHVSVSKDNGTTWINDFDIGASMGIKNAVFPEAKGGDSGRAACGFLGTTTAGNSDSLDFTGVWNLYIATTFDGGKTWTTVNATPNDPVQGAGGVCSGGISCSGTPNNRNLLDFNEITLGSNGRVLFGYDKGCIGGCVQDPTSNSFVSDMRVVRQSGGKTLFAKYDKPEPAKPNAACLAGVRDTTASHLTWKVPDSGGADIVNYSIYRSTDPASFGTTPIVTTANAKAAYDDTTSGTVTPIWYYKITALNSQGEGVYSNVVKLPIGNATAAESPCVVPGVTVATDVSGDETDMLPQHDVLSVQIAEPYNAAAPPGNNLVLSLNLSSASTIPPNTVYYIRFNLPDGMQYFVSYDTSNVPAVFSYGHVTTTTGTGTGMDNTDGTLDSSSAVDTTTNRLVFVLPKSDIAALANKAKLTAIVGESRLLAGAMGTGLIEQIDATSGGTGIYQQVGNGFCAPNTAPMAALSATPLSGNSPLTVAFDASGSGDSDTGDSVVSYSFDFNDGSATVAQSSPTISHTYTLASGSTQTNYKPTVTVTDTHGAASTNAAFAVIQVTSANTPPVSKLTATPTAGTAPLVVNFDGSGSSDPDAGDSVASYTFSFGDGSAAVTQTTPTLSHTYSAVGTYTASLSVIDSHGATSTNTAQQTITITAATSANTPPTARISATPTSSTVPLTVGFNGSASSDPDSGDSISSYRFDFGDGSAVITQTGPVISHTYSSVGTYLATLTVTDTHAATSATPATAAIVVTPVVTAQAPATGRLGGAFGIGNLLGLFAFVWFRGKRAAKWRR